MDVGIKIVFFVIIALVVILAVTTVMMKLEGFKEDTEKGIDVSDFNENFKKTSTTLFKDSFDNNHIGVYVL